MTTLAATYLSARGAGLGLVFARMDWRISLGIAVVCLIIWGIAKAVGSGRHKQQELEQPPQHHQPPYPPAANG